MVITHDYWVESESDKWCWQLDLFFSPVDMCRYKHTHTHTQAEIPESVHSGPSGKAQGLRCHGFSSCLLSLPLPFLSRLSVSLCTPPPCIYFTVMGAELRPSLPLRYSPQCLKLANSNWLQFLPQLSSSWNHGLYGHTCHAYSVSQNSMYDFLLKAGKMGGNPLIDVSRVIKIVTPLIFLYLQVIFP